MKNLQPRGLNRRRVEQLLSQTKDDRAIDSRIEVISRHFLGRPYQTNPLIGSADSAEVFTASIDRFDCVTYIETVVALARASTVDGFIEWLRKIRYERWPHSMGPAQSLHDALDSQQCTRRDNQARLNDGRPDSQHRARSECRTRTRSTSGFA